MCVRMSMCVRAHVYVCACACLCVCVRVRVEGSCRWKVEIRGWSYIHKKIVEREPVWRSCSVLEFELCVRICHVEGVALFPVW